MIDTTTGRRFGVIMPAQEAMNLLPKTGEGTYGAAAVMPNVRRKPAMRNGFPLGKTWWDFEVYNADQLSSQPKMGDNVTDAAGINYIIREPTEYRFLRTVARFRVQQTTGV